MVRMTVQPQSRKKPGPPATGKGTPIQVRMQPAMLKALDRHRASRDPKISRPEAIRQIIGAALGQPIDSD